MFPHIEDTLLTPREAAAMMGVHPSSIKRWHKMGRLKAIKTLGGHRRYQKSDVLKLRTWGKKGN